MTGRSNSAWVWKLTSVIPGFAYKIGLGPLIGHQILLLTTTGRRSGNPHAIPLQYELVGGEYFIGSARGTTSDWYRNILVNPEVWIRVKSQKFPALAMPITDIERITDYLELRFVRHPIMMGMMFRAQGWSGKPTRDVLQSYAKKRALVEITPKDWE